MASSSNEADLNNEGELDDNEYTYDSDEDTEDASETEIEKKPDEYEGIKDKMYHDQLSQYKHHIHLLKDGTLPSYVKKLKKIEQIYNDRIFMNQIIAQSQIELIDQEYKIEKDAAAKEFEERKYELKDSLIRDLEYKKKMIENERQTMELTGDKMSLKPITTRKLRRRPNDPMPVPEKRSKPSPVQLYNALDDQEISDDLAILSRLNKVKSQTNLSLGLMSNIPTSIVGNEFSHEVLIEDGRLCIDKKWFSKDQPIIMDYRENIKCNAHIVNISNDEICVRKVIDNSKVKIPVSQIQKGICYIKKKT